MGAKLLGAVWDYEMPDLVTREGINVPAPTAKNVLAHYANTANDSGEGAYEGIRTIKRKTQYSTQTVVNAVKALRDNSYLIHKGKSEHATNNYTVNLQKLGVLVARTPRSNGWNPPVLPTRTNPPTTGGESNLFAIYEQEIGPLTPLISEDIDDAEKTYTTAWVRDAILESARMGKRSWKYCLSILKRWKEQGNQDPGKKPAPAAKPKRIMPRIGEDGRVHV